MTFKNGDMPAMPDEFTGSSGLTKREMFCLHMGVAETGDAELDAIINKGNRQKVIAQIMCGLLSATEINVNQTGIGFVAGLWAASEASDLLRELERIE